MLSFVTILFSYLASSYYFAIKINKERYVSLWLILFFVLVLLSVEILGVFNIFTASGLFCIAIINLLVMLVFELRNIKKIAKFELHNILQDLRNYIRPKKIFYIYFVLISAVVLFSEFSPISEIDSIAYHLPIVSQLISTHGVWLPFHAAYVGPNTFFPANHEALQAFFALINGNMNFGFIVTFLSFLLLCSSLFDLRRNNVSKFFIIIIALSVTSVPFLFNQFLNLQIDLFMYSLFGSAIALMISSIWNDDKFDLAKSFLVLGILLGSKYNAIPQIIILIPFFVLIFYYYRRSLKRIFWYPVLSVIPGIFWYIRNWIIADNPIYPFGVDFGFINFEGHKSFIADTIGTSLWNHVSSDGFLSVFSHILNNNEFGIQLGAVSFLLLPAALLAGMWAVAIIVLDIIKYKETISKKQIWKLLFIIILFYVFLAEVFFYINSPYTYTLWHQTIRYASPVFALVPILFIISSVYSRILRTTIFYFSSGVLIFNVSTKSFFVDSDYLHLISEKASLISVTNILLYIFSIFLIVYLVQILIQFKTRSILSFVFLLIISFTLSAQQFYLSPYFLKNTGFDDDFLSQKLDIYPSILPHIKVLRSINDEQDEKIALSGLTPYWLFEKEGYSPIYVNIDGCITCQYFDYRYEENSVRSNPDVLKWKAALKTLGVKYLIVDFTSYSADKESYEESWAKGDTKMFTLLLATDAVSLYRIN